MKREQHLRRICLVGVRGVGKSTLIRRTLPSLAHIDHVLGSAILRELAGEDFAYFDTLAADLKQRYRERAVGWMEARQLREGRSLLCDGHTALLDLSIGKVVQVFTEQDCRFFRELILLEAAPETVQARRRLDSKPRALDLDTIQAELQGERELSRRIARSYGMQLHELPSGDDSLVAAQFRGILER